MFQAVRTFFWTNRATCREWLTRVRLQLMSIAQSQRSWASVVRHGYLLLAELTESTNSMVTTVVTLTSLVPVISSFDCHVNPFTAAAPIIIT